MFLCFGNLSSGICVRAAAAYLNVLLRHTQIDTTPSQQYAAASRTMSEAM